MNKAKTKKIIDIHPKYPSWLPAQLRNGWLLSCKINRMISDILKTSDLDKIDSVEGHITRRQCAVLFYYAYTQPGPGRIVEIGSFKGKSTICMALALKLSGKEDKVAAIDPHINTKDSETVPAYEEESSYDAFLSNVSRFELNEWVEPIKGTSEAVAKNWNQQIRLFFVDGSHRYEDVLMDLRLWEPLVNVGGIIILHDTKPGGQFPGVRRAMNEYLGNGKRFKELLQLLNLTIFEKISPA
jgi:predicted O-methyltransferase YrrM